MPRIKSAVKRVQVTERNRQKNVAYRSAVRTAIKRVIVALSGKDESLNVKESLNKAYSLIDRAILKGIFHKNTGARYKSNLAKAANKTTAA